jgi:hypothetical protein
MTVAAKSGFVPGGGTSSSDIFYRWSYCGPYAAASVSGAITA